MKRMTRLGDKIDKSIAIDSEGNIETAKDVIIDGSLRLNDAVSDKNTVGRLRTRTGKVSGLGITGTACGFGYTDYWGETKINGFTFYAASYNTSSSYRYQHNVIGIVDCAPDSGGDLGFYSVQQHVWQHRFYATNPSVVSGLTKLYGEVITTTGSTLDTLSSLTLSDYATSTEKGIERVPLHGSFTKNEKTYEIIQGYRVSRSDYRYGLLGLADNGETAELIIDEDTAGKVLLNDTTRDF